MGQAEAAPLPEAQEDGRGDDQRGEGERVAHRVDDVKRQELPLRGALWTHGDMVYRGAHDPPLPQPAAPGNRGYSAPLGSRD